MKLDKHRVWQLFCFAILLAFITFAFTVDAKDCEPSNVQQLQALAAKMNADERTLVSIDPLKPWALTTKRELEYYKKGKLPPEQYLDMRKP